MGKAVLYPANGDSLLREAKGEIKKENFKNAERLCRKAIELDRAKTDSCMTMGIILRNTNRPAEALEYYKLALTNDPSGSAELFFEIGFTLTLLGDLPKAVAAFNKALSMKPDFIEAYLSAGKTFNELGQFDSAEIMFGRAKKLDPKNLLTFTGLADSAIGKNDYYKAIGFIEEAVELYPSDSDITIALACLYRNIGDFTKAAEILQKLIKKYPEPAAKIQDALLFPAIMESREHIEKSRKRFFDKLDALEKENFHLANPEIAAKGIPFYQGYHGLNNKEIMIRMAKFFEKASPHLLYTAPHCRNLQNKKARLRVGIVSEYLYNHVVSTCFCDLVEQLAKQDGLEVVAFSASARRDEWTERFIKASHKFHFIPRDITAAQQIIAAQECDVLFFLDIGMSHFTYFLAFARLASVQCTSGGHPITSGITNMDYFLSAKTLEPENGQKHYSEKLALFENNITGTLSPKILQDTKTRQELNLPEGRLYTLPTMLFRIHPDMDYVFSQILKKDEHAKIILFEHYYKNTYQELLEKRFEKNIGESLSGRIIFIPYAHKDNFIHVLRNMDAIMDPFHFSFGTTIYTLLKANLPFVTLEGEFMRGRAAYWAYKRMGIEGLTAKTPDEYVDIVMKLSNDKNFREEKSEAIKENSNVMFENKAVVKELAEFFRKSYEEKAIS